MAASLSGPGDASASASSAWARQYTQLPSARSVALIASMARSTSFQRCVPLPARSAARACHENTSSLQSGALGFSPLRGLRVVQARLAQSTASGSSDCAPCRAITAQAHAALSLPIVCCQRSCNCSAAAAGSLAPMRASAIVIMSLRRVLPMSALRVMKRAGLSHSALTSFSSALPRICAAPRAARKRPNSAAWRRRRQMSSSVNTPSSYRVCAISWQPLSPSFCASHWVIAASCTSLPARWSISVA